MIFVIEKLFQDHRTRVETWERARQKWLEENDYYTQREYNDRHPRPGHTLKIVAQVLMVGLLIGILLVIIFGVATGAKDHHEKHQGQAAIAQKKENKKSDFKIDDKVQVVYGDYEDSVGIIVKLTNDSAIIKLTHSTLTHAMCNASSSCSEGGGHDDGELLGIASLDNLVPYKEVK